MICYSKLILKTTSFEFNKNMVSGDRREYDVCRSCQENTQRRECQLFIWECSLLIPWSNTSDTSWSFYPTPRILPDHSNQHLGYFLIILSNTSDTSWSFYPTPRILPDHSNQHLGYFLIILSNTSDTSWSF